MLTVRSLSTASALAVSSHVGSDCASPESSGEDLTLRHHEYFTLGSSGSFLFGFLCPTKACSYGSQIVLMFSPPQKKTVLHLCGSFPFAKRMAVNAELRIDFRP